MDGAARPKAETPIANLAAQKRPLNAELADAKVTLSDRLMRGGCRLLPCSGCPREGKGPLKSYPHPPPTRGQRLSAEQHATKSADFAIAAFLFTLSVLHRATWRRSGHSGSVRSALQLRRRTAAPVRPNPAINSIQLAGSGTSHGR